MAKKTTKPNKPNSQSFLISIVVSVIGFAVLCILDFVMNSGQVNWLSNALIALILCVVLFLFDSRSRK